MRFFKEKVSTDKAKVAGTQFVMMCFENPMCSYSRSTYSKQVVAMFKSTSMKVLGLGALAFFAYKYYRENSSKDSNAEVFNVEIVQRPQEVYGQRAGRAVGQTLLDNTYTEGLNIGLPDLQTSSAGSRNASGEEVKSTMWEGQITDTSLKYRVGSFGTNFSGSAIGVAQ